MRYVFTVEYHSVMKTNEILYDNMDGTRGHYVKQSKPGTEGQVPHDLTHLWHLKILTP